ncbi:MAG: hypothetical protein WC444_06850 [Candidatus Paceibacterota bacterium]
MTKCGLRRSNFKVKDLDVSGQVTGNVANPVMVSGAGNVWYVDASKATGASGDGTTWDEAFITIQEGVTAASAGDVVYVAAQTHTDYTGDPVSYSENIIIPYATSNLALIGVSRGRTQGGLPQLKVGTTTTSPIIAIRAPGCLIANLGINGNGGTGGGILFDDDYAAKAAFGTTIVNCHFKNCVGTTATNAATGGAIQWGSAGNAWQILISGCTFYKNVGGVVLKGTSTTQPQDVIIEDCTFMGGASVDCHLFLKGGGSGILGLIVRNCDFDIKPAVGSGTNAIYADFTGCTGTLAGCMFGCATQGAGLLTFKAAGTGAKVPATMFLSGNFGEADTEGDTGYIYRAA